MTNSKPELLAPGGDIDAIKAAIIAGADAIYCGFDRFNARNGAKNISLDNLQGILILAHQHNCKIFLTLNIVILENEIPDIISLLNKLVNTSIDGLIVQDLGLFYILSTHFKSLKIHASTQCTTHNEGQIAFLSKLGVERVNLSRELDIHEIKRLSQYGKKLNIGTEVFVHGSNCICFSGICFISSVQSGNSGNRGRCSQPCRDKYQKTAADKDYPLNLKDNSAFFNLKELVDIGVQSLKIEGRIKKYDYVFTVVDTWRKHLDSFFTEKTLNNDNSTLYKVFNRDFSDAFLTGDIHKDLFIDSPRDHSITHLSEIKTYTSDEALESDHLKLYAEKKAIQSNVERIINKISIAKKPLSIDISGTKDAPLIISVKTEDTVFEISSNIHLSMHGTEALNRDTILKKLKAINDTEYSIESLNLENLQSNVYLPFKELTAMKSRILYVLNGSKALIEPIAVPNVKNRNPKQITPKLSILIATKEDVSLYKSSKASIYFEIPNSITDKLEELIALFSENPQLIPWFPSVLIGKDYDAAIELLYRVHPSRIVSNNTGIGFEASEMGISWIAGPHLNITNSFSLECLKERFNCSGAFISNELNKNQIRNIQCPEDFELHYSIYHPILLMTSRQCLFHTVTGCVKDKIDADCIGQCEKSADIINSKGEQLFIEKSKGNYHTIYSNRNFLNTAIFKDISNQFSNFLLDLRDIETKTAVNTDKLSIITHFEHILNGNLDLTFETNALICPTTNEQYLRGL